MRMAKGIYKRGNIYWIRYAGLDGKTVLKSSGSTKYREAETLLIQRRQETKEGKQPEIKRIANHSFKELAEKYSQWMQVRHRSADSKMYRINQLVTQFGILPLRRFNTLIVEQYQTDLINKGLKPASVNKNISLLKAVFNKAVDWYMVDEGVLKNVRKVKLLPENNRRLRYLSKEECTELVNSCEPHLRPIVITALNTGMRKGEILNLKWEHVDLNHGFILLEITKNGERREVPINKTLRRTLNDITRRIDVPHVFFDSKTGKPYQNVRRSFATALRRVKIIDFKFHDLRHTFASHLVMSGVDITTVSRLLGHKSLTMTLRYSHLAPSHMANAVDLLDNAINGESTIQLLYNRSNLKTHNLPKTAVSH
jgi:integrase